MEKNIYKKFALFYDEINNSDFYNHYVSFIKRIIKENNIRNPHILDLACGTGILIQKLRSRYSNIEGVDMSKEMLAVARKKNKGTPLYNQNFTNVNTKKKYDVIVSTFDSINYVTSKKDLNRTLKNVAGHLNKGGFFVFDFNTIHKKIPFVIKKKNVVFENSRKGNYWDVVIRIKKGGKVYIERHRERLYSFKEMCSTLVYHGLKIAALYAGFNKKITKPNRYQRLFIIAQKL